MRIMKVFVDGQDKDGTSTDRTLWGLPGLIIRNVVRIIALAHIADEELLGQLPRAKMPFVERELPAVAVDA